MPANDRSEGRVLFIWDGSKEEYIGGLADVTTLTKKDFLQMLDVLLVRSPDTLVQDENGDEVIDNDDQLQEGHYVVWSENLQVTDEPAWTRSLSVLTGPCVEEFRQSVQQRDGRCVITKVQNTRARYNMWHGFQAAHVFPLAYPQHWMDGNYGRGITMVPSVGGKINSVQNGLLLRNDVHADFDHYCFSINVNNGYKVVLFYPDIANIAGQALDERLLNAPSRPPDYLLEWHFRQAVLTNMRRAGEPVFEDDFPPSSDMMGEIIEGPKPAERLEFEFANRLGAWYDFEQPQTNDKARQTPGTEAVMQEDEHTCSPIPKDDEDP